MERTPNDVEARPVSEVDWMVWQLVDSAFPTGGFVHSAGLEAAVQCGEVLGREGLEGFLDASLGQVASTSLPLVRAAHQDPERLPELDAWCHAFTSNHVGNRASRLQGRAFGTAVQRIFGLNFPALVQSHLAPLFGAALCQLRVPLAQTGHLFLFGHLRTVLAAAVRLNVVGPLEAQTLQHRFSRRAREVHDAHVERSVEELVQTAPLLELWQSSQDRLYSRLFQS